MKGTISINCYHGTNIVAIVINDEASRVQFLKVEMTVAEFGSAMFGRGDVNCEFELRGVELIGKTREHKTEIIRTWRMNLTGIEAADLLKPFEVDGWMGDVKDLQNHHNIVKAHERMSDGFEYRVGFVRYVETASTTAE